jgi:phenylpyruvate tautomerase PptA (4-oxalocrotonate tautomerase family)
MPIVEVALIEGYDDDTKARLARAITHAVGAVIDVPADLTTVMLRDVPPANYFRGGIARSPGTSLPDPKTLVERYLTLMENRALDEARTLLHPDFEMVFPGDQRFRDFDSLIAWAKPRYRWVRKRFQRFDAGPAEDGVAVTCFGTLYGERHDGTTFEGVRYVDWFLLKGGLIARQEVWNDMAEMGLTPTR